MSHRVEPDGVSGAEPLTKVAFTDPESRRVRGSGAYGQHMCRAAIPPVRDLARKIDGATAVLEDSRGKDVALKAPWAVSMRVFHQQPSHWTSRCVSRYYGLNSFRVTR